MPTNAAAVLAGRLNVRVGWVLFALFIASGFHLSGLERDPEFLESSMRYEWRSTHVYLFFGAMANLLGGAMLNLLPATAFPRPVRILRWLLIAAGVLLLAGHWLQQLAPGLRILAGAGAFALLGAVGQALFLQRDSRPAL